MGLNVVKGKKEGQLPIIFGEIGSCPSFFQIEIRQPALFCGKIAGSSAPVKV
jgi:hypothetical protein